MVSVYCGICTLYYRYWHRYRSTFTFLFIKIDRVIVTQVGFCVIAPWSLPRFLSNHQKALLYDGYSIYITIFNSFHAAVYPVGVTTNRSCFTQIIGHNSRTNHKICTKFDARICLWIPFLCTTFQDNRSMYLHFIAIFASVQKHKEKMKKKI